MGLFKVILNFRVYDLQFKNKWQKLLDVNTRPQK